MSGNELNVYCLSTNEKVASLCPCNLVVHPRNKIKKNDLKPEHSLKKHNFLLLRHNSSRAIDITC